MRILFFPFAAIGHMTPAIGVAKVLIGSGHTVIFAVNDQWEGKLSEFQIQELLLPDDFKAQHLDPSQHFAQFMFSTGLISDLSPQQKFINLCKELIEIQTKICKKLDQQAQILINETEPDIIIVDHTYCVPSIEKSGIPWVVICCLNPLDAIKDERTPPRSSGLSVFDNIIEWKKFRESVNFAEIEVWNPLNDYLISRGMKSLEKYKFFRESKFLNIYSYPQELDYSDIRPLPPKWYRFDNFFGDTEETPNDIPSDFLERDGKLIYLSLGSIGSVDIQLMKRLIAILAKSEHKFIVSKGPKHECYQLADNMWGKKSLPQIQILSIVDLVVTHGGNNTIAETFYFGKPMIVLPLFGDQYDNAQRLQDKVLGIRLNPYRCTESQLLSAINDLLNKTELNERLQQISKRIKFEKSIEKLPQILENLVLK